MKWFVSRIKEPSTWAGIAILAGTFGDALAGGAGVVGAGVAAALAVIMKEKKNG